MTMVMTMMTTMMKRGTRRVMITLLLLTATICTKAQMLAVSTDAPWLLMQTANVAAEIVVANKSSVVVSAMANHKPWGKDLKLMALQPEYRYYFFWPEDFQIGPGLAYSFSRLSVHDAAIGMDKYSGEFRESAVFAANAFALSANMRYKIRPFGMDIAVRYRPHFIRSVSTSSSGYNDLSETLWHHSLEIGGRVFYEF